MVYKSVLESEAFLTSFLFWLSKSGGARGDSFSAFHVFRLQMQGWHFVGGDGRRRSTSTPRTMERWKLFTVLPDNGIVAITY